MNELMQRTNKGRDDKWIKFVLDFDAASASLVSCRVYEV